MGSQQQQGAENKASPQAPSSSQPRPPDGRTIEERLLESEERFRAVFEQAAVGIGTLSLDGYWIEANRKLCEILGYDAEELRRLRFQDITHPADVDESVRSLQRLLKGEIGSYSLQKRYYRKDGSVVWVKVAVALVPGTAGRPGYIISVVEDITDRMQAAEERERLLRSEREAREAAEAASRRLSILQGISDVMLSSLPLNDLLRELLSRLRAFLATDTATVLLLAKDGQNLYVRASSGLQAELGKQARVPVGRGFAGRIFASRQPAIMEVTPESEIVSPVLRQNIKSLMGVPLVVGDRAIGVLHVGTKQHRDFSAEDLRLLRLVADRAAAAIERSLLYESEARARREAEQRSQEMVTVFEAIGDGLVVHSATGELLEMNHRAEVILNVGFEEYRKMPLRDAIRALHLLKPDGQPVDPAAAPTVRALHGERVLGEHLLIGASNGQVTHLLVSAAPIKDERGQVIGAVTDFNDITDVVELQRTQQEMASIVAHDIRQPLTIILGQAQLLERWLDAGQLEQARKASAAVATSAQRMNAMIQDLVDSIRMDVGRLQLQKKPVDLHSFLRDLLQRSATAMPTSRVRLIVAPGMPPVPADPDRLERIVSNLLSNALKYSDPASPVYLRVEQEGNHALISVRDQGPGIAPEDRPHIFDRFYRTRGPQRKDSVGLGLYISRLLVEAHGGRIWVESREGEGSTFYFTLPLG